MDDTEYWVVRQLDNARSLCISALSRKAYEETAADAFPSNRGYFLYERDDSEPGRGINVLAKVASLEAAFRLAELWQFQPVQEI